MGDETNLPTAPDPESGRAANLDPDPADVRITVLGAVSLTRAGVPVNLSEQKQRTLAILVAAGPGGESVDWLAEQIWADQLPSGWRAQLRVIVNRLAHSLPFELRSGGRRYGLPVATTAVDAWELLDLDRTATEWQPRFEPLLAAPDLFRSIEPFPAMAAAIEEYRAAQHSALARLSRCPEPEARHLVLAARHHDSRPDDEALCATVAAIHARAHRTDEALARIDRTIEVRRADGRTSSTALDELRAAISDGTFPPSPAAPSPPSPIGPSPTTAGPFPAPPTPADSTPASALSAERFRTPHFVGRKSELEALNGIATGEPTPVTVIRGRAAWGKTTLLGEAMHLAAVDGAHVVRVAGSEGGRVGLGPFSSALPAFRSLLANDDTPVADSLPRRGVLAARLLDLLVAEADGRRVVVVVDDAHWLDSMSCDAVEYLAHAAGDGQLSLVVAARPNEGDTPWLQLEQALDRLPRITSISLEPLSEADVAQLVEQRRPGASFANRVQLARWLHQASGGLPGVANALLDEGADADAAHAGTPLPARPDVAEVYDRRLAPLSEDARQVGGGAAVLGSPFRQADLARLLDRPETDLDPALAELHRHGLLIDGADLGSFELSHQLVAEALLRGLLSTRRARLHQRAAGLGGSVHDLARHLLAARTLVPPDLTQGTVISSARQHLAAGAYWEAVAAFRAAVGVGAASLDVAAMVDYATSLSLAGMRNRSVTVRGRAYEQAVADGRWDLALEAALSGLPAAETSDGEHDRLTQLLAIPPECLDPARRVRQAVNVARQAVMVGRLTEAATWAARARDLASDDDEQAQAALTERFVGAVTTGAAERLARMEAATEGLAMTASARCRLAQFVALDKFCCGALDEARKAQAEFRSLADSSGDALRQWHAGIFDSLLHDNDGDWPAADAAADDALALGHRYGITSATILRLAQVYFRLRLTGDLALLAGSIDAVPGDDGESVMFAAARATILEAAGHESEARAETVRIARMVTEHPSAAGFGSLVILAPLVGRYGPPSLVQATHALLAPLEGSAYVLAVGIGNLGPVDYLTSSLDRPTGRALEQVLRRAIRQSDDFHMLPWQVRYRLDLAAVTGSDEAREQAQALALGTSLAPLAERDPTTLAPL